MRTQMSIDKTHNYLNSQLFPWNFLIEPVSEEALGYFVKHGIPAGRVEKEELGPDVQASDIIKVINQKVEEIAKDYLVDPHNEYARRTHEKFADDYPFAYSQCLVYFLLSELKTSIGQVTDIKSVTELMGIDIDSFKNKEKTIRQLISEHKSKPEQIGLLGQSIIGREVTYGDLSLIGKVHDIIFDKTTGKIAELIVEGKQGLHLPEFKTVEDERSIDIPVQHIKLSCVYNDYVTFKY